MISPESDLAHPLFVGGGVVAQALGDGEDFELLFAVDAGWVAGLLAAWPFAELKLTVIGCLTEAGMGEAVGGGWDHFAAE